MGSIVVALVSFGCIVVGIIAGLMLRKALPEHHLRDDSKDVVKLGTGFIATLSALVLGLLVSSAKNSFDAVNNGLTQNGAKVIALDRALSQCGPEARDVRQALRKTVAGVIQRGWPEERSELVKTEAVDTQRGMDMVRDGIQKLCPQDETQKWFRSQAVQMSADLALGRWQLIEQAQISLPTPFLVVLVSWLTILFACFAVLAPRNTTMVGVLLLCASSASGAIFLIMEMCHPEAGLMKASCAPMLKALSLLGQ